MNKTDKNPDSHRRHGALRRRLASKNLRMSTLHRARDPGLNWNQEGGTGASPWRQQVYISIRIYEYTYIDISVYELI